MERAEILEKIEDYTEKRAQSLNQTNLALIAAVQAELKQHELKSIQLREQFYRDMMETITKAVDEGIKKYVNGKIDKMQKGLDEAMKRMEPVLHSFEIQKAAFELKEKEAKEAEVKDAPVKRFVGWIGYIAVVGGAILWIINKLKITQ